MESESFSFFCFPNPCQSPHRDASPDEVILTFTVTDAVGIHIREILIGDVIDGTREREAVMNLIDYIAILIEKYTKEKPVLR